MLIRKNLPSAVKTAAVVDKGIVHCRKHIDIQFRQIQLLQEYPPFIRVIEIAVPPLSGSRPDWFLHSPDSFS